MSKTRWTHWLSSLAALGLLGAGSAVLTGCEDSAYCFRDCGPNAGNASSSGGVGGGDTDGGLFDGGGDDGGCGLFGCPDGGGTGGGGPCMQTNGGIEACDGLDNDCNNVVDDVAGLDTTKPETCGVCSNNCYALPSNWGPGTIGCTAPANPGEPGTCTGSCDTDYYDIDKSDGKGFCEYYCSKKGTGLDDATCDVFDDDCDGVKNEDVDVCTDTQNCGACGKTCVALNGTAQCVNTGGAPCTLANTACEIANCNCNGPGDCWWDADGLFLTGCEYKCDATGPEVCDGFDNDCDGKIDGADDLSGDPNLGITCYGSPFGVCGQAAHAGMTQCSAGQIVCGGANVLKPNDLPEMCNGQDDDCDNVVDDNPSDAGNACGISNIAPCSFGTQQCVNGALACVGAVNPGVEMCNGIDDDCDGTVDKAMGMPPMDATGPCDVPPMAPNGATQPCKAGLKSCIGGTVTCVGSVGPSSQNDGCGDDSNCDGQLTNQPNTMTDVQNCGGCGMNCYMGAVHSTWGCTNGACVFQGCEPGYYDLNNDQKCEYACIFVSAQESCNGIDDNCNGTIDENVIAPAPVQAGCGISPAAVTPECTSGVSVACMNGGWKCTFPANVCNPTCATATEVCDTLDNNCNGLTNENVANYGKPCASDDGLPAPGHGACRTTGTYICNGQSATMCNAVKANCATLPGGCDEKCDGVDNDCDGSIDEAFNAKGNDAMYFVKPAVTKVNNAPNTWIFTYEASRPSSTNQTAGQGNGYWTSAPVGATLDKTPACSVNNKIPWFNVSPLEVEQTCTAMGGSICDTSTQWKKACEVGTGANACTWGYNPFGAACKAAHVAGSKYCNLAPSYDFLPATPGDQDGLLPTASGLLLNCFADWATATSVEKKVFDITGNLREITKSGANTYPLMGGAFNHADPNGATCQFSFYTVDQNYKLFDTGFRCCFTSDPTL